MIPLQTLSRCFEGVVPSTVATCSADGIPNISVISHVHQVDSRHVALSRQFFNKTTRNFLENPRARVTLWDPVTFEVYELTMCFVRSETSGPVFDRMAVRIDAIASHTGMSGIFRLLAADVFEVTSLEKKHGFTTVPREEPDRMLPEGPLTDIRGLHLVSDRVGRACNLDELLNGSLAALDERLTVSS